MAVHPWDGEPVASRAAAEQALGPTWATAEDSAVEPVIVEFVEVVEVVEVAREVVASGTPVPGAVEGSVASCGVNWATVLRPTTPLTSLTNEDGTDAVARAARATRPSARRARTSGTEKACSTVATVPVAGTRSPLDDVVPTWSPADCNQSRTLERVAAVGP